MAKKWRRMRVGIQANQYERCNVCDAFRDRIGRLCKKHKWYEAQNGSPYVSAKLIQRRWMKKEYREVKTFLSRNLNHPAVAAGLAFVETWLWNDGLGMDDIRSTKVDMHIARLREAGVTPLQILEQLCALYLFSRRQVWVPDGTPLTFSMANFVLSLATIRQRGPGLPRRTTRAGDVTGGTRRMVGETLRTALAPLLFSVADALMRRHMETKGQRADIRIPLDPATYRAPAPSRVAHANRLRGGGRQV